MNLQRILPKQKMTQTKCEPIVELVDNPSADSSRGAKAGKSHFIVLVGEATNGTKMTALLRMREIYFS